MEPSNTSGDLGKRARGHLDPVEALRASEERLRLALEAGASGAWDWDMRNDVADVSPSYRDLFGLAPDASVTYESWLASVHPEDRERCRAYGEGFFPGSDCNWRLQFRVVTPHKGVRWHRAVGKVYRDPAGKPLRFVGVEMDVTDEQRAVAALSESEERFRTMADGLPLIIWVHDAAGEQQFVNRTFLEFFGVDEAQMKGGRWKLLMHPDDGSAYADEFMACLRERRPFHAEVRVRNAAGEWRTIESWGRPRWSANGEFLGMVGTSVDVTERRRMDQALREADRRKDEFLAILGHELRNPLATISVAMELFRRQLPEDSPLRPVREAAERQTRILLRLVDDLLDSARIATGKIALQRVRVSLHDVLRAAVDTTRPVLESRRHRIIVEEADLGLEVEGDEIRLVQIVANILNNAARYTPKGGRIEASIAQEGEEAVLRVRDNGLGIEADKLHSVFDIFMQGEPGLSGPEGGLGLGLALVKRLVELHGGSVSATSEGRNKGSQFVVRLPLWRTESAGGDATPPVHPASRAARTYRVLVVDDNQDAAAALSSLLAELGHEVLKVYDGPSAVDAVQEFAPDLVLLDIGMPGMDGYETAKRIRALPAGSTARIYAASGYGNGGVAVADSAMDGYLVKPVQVGDLERIFRKID